MAPRQTRVDVLFGLAYHPDWRVRRLAQALADAGYEVRILAWDRDGLLPQRERDAAVRVERVHVRSRSGRGWTQLAYLARAVPGWLRAMRRDPPDVIHAVDLPMLAIALLSRWLVPGRPVVVYDAFEIYSVMEAHKYPAWVLWLVAIAERRLPRAAALVITPGLARQSYFARRGVASVVVGNWVNPPRPRPGRAPSRRRLGIDADRFCIGYAGGLEPSRDIGALIEHARRNRDDLVVVAGRGEQAAACAAAADELPNFRFLGWLPDPAPLYAASDVIFYALRANHPYAGHAAPNNLYTAIAYAVPMVFRPQGELADVAARTTIGATFDTMEELDGAVAALRNQAERDRVRRNLRALQAYYSWERARAVLTDAYPMPPTVPAPPA